MYFYVRFGNVHWPTFDRQTEVKEEVNGSDEAQSDTTDEEDFTLTPSDLQIQYQVAYDSEVKQSEYKDICEWKMWSKLRNSDNMNMFYGH